LSRPVPVPPPPRVTLRLGEAAAALGMSGDAFREYVLPEVRIIRRGRLRLVPLAELERWADEAAVRTLPGDDP
jgi:hypothetical protein